MKEIPLTRGLVAIVDDEDYEMLMQWKWRAHKSSDGYGYYAETLKWHPRVDLKMHRLVAMASKGEIVDHINHNKLDNRRVNLRICTPAGNCANSMIRKDNTTGYKGVSLRGNGKYVSAIRENGKRNQLGTFLSPELAAAVYDAAALRIFGEYALTNKMMGLL